MENDDRQEIDIDSFTLDCADYFMAVLQRKYPSIDFQLSASRPWRLCWEISVPEGMSEAVEEDAYNLMKDIFNEHGTLLSYTLNPQKEKKDA